MEYIYLIILIFRSSLVSAEQALKIKPDYEKTIMRAINCCIQLKEFDKCLDYCDKYLEQVPDDNNVVKIKKETIKSKVNIVFNNRNLMLKVYNIINLNCFRKSWKWKKEK